MLYLYGASGTTYFYIHLNNDRTPGTTTGAAAGRGRLRAGAEDRQRVRAGQLIAYVGDSGDANGIGPTSTSRCTPTAAGPSRRTCPEGAPAPLPRARPAAPTNGSLRIWGRSSAPRSTSTRSAIRIRVTTSAPERLDRQAGARRERLRPGRGRRPPGRLPADVRGRHAAGLRARRPRDGVDERVSGEPRRPGRSGSSASGMLLLRLRSRRSGAERPRRARAAELGVVRVPDRPDDRDSPCAGGDHVLRRSSRRCRRWRTREPGVGGRVADVLEARGGPALLRRRRVHRPDAGVVGLHRASSAGEWVETPTGIPKRRATATGRSSWPTWT